MCELTDVHTDTVPTFLQHRVDHLSVSHQLQISVEDLLKGGDLLLQTQSAVC